MASTFAVLAVTALGAAALASVATGISHYKSTVTLGATLVGGKVSSPKAACVAGRKVAVRYTDARGKTFVFGRATTSSTGSYRITPGGTPGRLPFKFRAYVGALATHRYICDGDASNPRLISGG
ncbi:MAG: hypothetical protein U0R52_12895 [Solirubrobacterales bacterium]